MMFFQIVFGLSTQTHITDDEAQRNQALKEFYNFRQRTSPLTDVQKSNY